MLSRETINLCIVELDLKRQSLFRQMTNSEEWMKHRSKVLYEYEHALYELKNELQTTEEENLNE